MGSLGRRWPRTSHPALSRRSFRTGFVPQEARRDLAAILEGAERGQQVMRAQRYDILNAIADGDYVALEVAWAGTLAIPVGTLAAGGEMRARFAVFLQFGDGKIVRQRNYDCFEPW